MLETPVNVFLFGSKAVLVYISSLFSIYALNRFIDANMVRRAIVNHKYGAFLAFNFKRAVSTQVSHLSFTRYRSVLYSFHSQQARSCLTSAVLPCCPAFQCLGDTWLARCSAGHAL